MDVLPPPILAAIEISQLLLEILSGQPPAPEAAASGHTPELSMLPSKEAPTGGGATARAYPAVAPLPGRLTDPVPGRAWILNLCGPRPAPRQSPTGCEAAASLSIVVCPRLDGDEGTGGGHVRLSLH